MFDGAFGLCRELISCMRKARMPRGGGISSSECCAKPRRLVFGKKVVRSLQDLEHCCQSIAQLSWSTGWKQATGSAGRV